MWIVYTHYVVDEVVTSGTATLFREQHHFPCDAYGR